MINSKQVLQQLLADEAYSVFIRKVGSFRFEENYKYDWDEHPEIEINYVNSGCCIMEVENEYIPLKKGDCIIIYPDVRHCFMVDIKEKCSITQLEFRVNTKESHTLKFLSLLDRNRREKGAFKINNCESIQSCLMDIRRYNAKAKQHELFNVAIQTSLIQLYVELSYAIEMNQKIKNTNQNDKLSRILEHINFNYAYDIDIEEICTEHQISSRYIRKRMTEETGMSTVQYINVLRVNKAKELLASNTRSITDIALLCGFNTPQYFSKIFKNYTGVTPSYYQGDNTE